MTLPRDDAADLRSVAFAVENAGRAAIAAANRAVADDDRRGVTTVIDGLVEEQIGAAQAATARAKLHLARVAAGRAAHERLRRMAEQAVGAASEAAARSQELAGLPSFGWLRDEDDPRVERALALSDEVDRLGQLAVRRAVALRTQAEQLDVRPRP